jgi:hypothetical protein
MVQTFHSFETNDFSSGGLRLSTCGEKLKGVKMTKGRLLALIVIVAAFAIMAGIGHPVPNPIHAY